MDPSMPDVHLEISLLPRVWPPCPSREKTTLRRLVSLLTTFATRADITDKLMLPSWSPAIFTSADATLAVDVVSVSCLVLDLDEQVKLPTGLPWDDCFQIWHSTWSHTPELPRLRIVIPLLHPAPGEIWSAAWHWAARFVPTTDRNCKNANRAYILPARPSTGCESFTKVKPGPLFDLLGALPSPQKKRRVPALRQSVLKVPPRLRGGAIRRRLARDPITRQRAAHALGAKVAGCDGKTRAEKIICPACGRRSAWFWVAPERQTRAHCHHENSCGWSGSLDELLAEGAP